MAQRSREKQSNHDAAVRAAKAIYEKHDKYAWINPGNEKNRAWAGEYVDVIAVEDRNADRGWVIEVETDDSVSDDEAEDQWQSYDTSFTERWHLAVPEALESAAERLLQKYGIENCKVITWKRNEDGTHTYWGLPGLD